MAILNILRTICTVTDPSGSGASLLVPFAFHRVVMPMVTDKAQKEAEATAEAEPVTEPEVVKPKGKRKTKEPVAVA
jgi:hypothetical protein